MRIKISLPVEAFQARVSLVFTLPKKQVRKELIPSLEYDERQVLILRDFLINLYLKKESYRSRTGKPNPYINDAAARIFSAAK